jgi:hypothetical protein
VFQTETRVVADVAPSTELTTFGELLEILDNVNKQSQYRKQLDKLKLAI